LGVKRERRRTGEHGGGKAEREKRSPPFEMQKSEGKEGKTSKKKCRREETEHESRGPKKKDQLMTRNKLLGRGEGAHKGKSQRGFGMGKKERSRVMRR